MNYNYNYDYPGTTAGTVAAITGVWLAFVIFFAIVGLALAVVLLISMWKMFEKAGKPGWYAIIPIYNAIILLDIIGYKWYYIFAFALSGIPAIGWIAALLFSVTYSFKLVRAFGKSEPMPFVLGVIFLPYIFLPVMAFSKNIKYTGQVVKGDIDFNDLF